MLDDGVVYCSCCVMFLNGPVQWEDHRIGKKHKKRLKRFLGLAASSGGKLAADKGLVVPRGTVAILTQEALWRDATMAYVASLVARGLVRAKL